MIRILFRFNAYTLLSDKVIIEVKGRFVKANV